MRRRRSLVDYFLAVMGLAFLLFILAIILTPGSCRLRTETQQASGNTSPALPR